MQDRPAADALPGQSAHAAAATSRLEIGTNIAVAFARSPFSMAQIAWDLQRDSGGRFRLGLGTQVRAHIERRFSMPWSKPAARMREMVQAVHAIWDSWDSGAPLAFAAPSSSEAPDPRRAMRVGGRDLEAAAPLVPAHRSPRR